MNKEQEFSYRMWLKLNYNPEKASCENCKFYEHSKSVKTIGRCLVIDDMPFTVFGEGICRSHSGFRLEGLMNELRRASRN